MPVNWDNKKRYIGGYIVRRRRYSRNITVRAMCLGLFFQLEDCRLWMALKDLGYRQRQAHRYHNEKKNIICPTQYFFPTRE